jgi:hypothetical protein
MTQTYIAYAYTFTRSGEVRSAAHTDRKEAARELLAILPRLNCVETCNAYQDQSGVWIPDGMNIQSVYRRELEPVV